MSWPVLPRSVPCTKQAPCRVTRWPPPLGWPRSICSTTAAYVQLESTAHDLANGIAKAFAGAGVEARVPVEATLVGLYFGAAPAVDYASARATDEAAYARTFHAMLARGVAIAPGAYEVLFPGLAHTAEVVEEVISVAEDAAAAIG